MTEPFMLRAMAAGLALALVAAPLGCFVVWRRMAYFGETIAQGGLIGVALGVALSLDITASVLAMALALAALLLLLGRQTRVPMDSVLGVLAHAALAIGIVLAALVRGPNVDLVAVLFGDIYAVSHADLRWIIGGGVVAFIVLMRIWQPLLSLSDSVAAVAQLAAQQGGAAARGRDTIDVVSTVLAAARAGRRDRFGTAVYEALRANPPQPPQGVTGKVTVEFRVGASGAADAVRVATSSGIAALDQAAVAAVREARLPAPPSDIDPVDLVYTMEYTFR